MPPFTHTIKGQEYNLPGLSEEAVRLFGIDGTQLSVLVSTEPKDPIPTFHVLLRLSISRVNDLEYEYWADCADRDVEHLYDEADRYRLQYESEVPDEILREWITDTPGCNKTVSVPSQEIGNRLIRAYYAHLIRHDFRGVELVIRGVSSLGFDVYQVMDEQWALKGDKEH